LGFYRDRVFPLLCGWATGRFEKERDALLGVATGKVLEIGVGGGASFVHYASVADRVVGLEYSSAMLNKARSELQRLRAASRLRTSVELVQGSVTALGFADETFDTVISFLVFCSLPEPEAGAREIFRVLKSGGRFLFFEHVVAPHERIARWQRRLNPIWNKVACGCNLTRDTRGLFEKAGFRFEEIREYVHEDSMKLTSHKIQGIAVRPRC